MDLLLFKTKTDLDKKNQTEKAALLCYFHYRETQVSQFSMGVIQSLFSDAGYSTVNTSRLRSSLCQQKLLRAVSASDKQLLEFVPVVKQKYDQELGTLWQDFVTIVSESELLDETKFCGKKGYNFLDSLIKQINYSYVGNCYDACAVLLRRLFEIMLILSFQKAGIDNEIKDSRNGGAYVMLDTIVTKAVNSSTLKLSRIKNRFDDFRKVGNFSAHNIYYVAARKDIDDIKIDYRTMLEELYNKAGIM